MKLNRDNQMLLIKKIIFVTLTIIMTLCLLELSLKTPGYIILKLNPPSIDERKIKDKNEFIILCLGDSYTFGLGTEYQYSYPRQLERVLNMSFPQNIFRVYNLGIPGSNSSQLVNALQYNIDKYDPDLLIIMTGRNDSWNFTDAYCPSLSGRLDSVLSNLSVYKLTKVGIMNLIKRCRDNVLSSTASGEGSINTYKEEIHILPESSQQTIVGNNLAEQGRYDLAEEYFLKALQLDPQNVDAARNLGGIYREEGKYDLAEKYLTQILSRGGGPGYLSAYLELGMIHRLQKKYDLAKKELKEAIRDLDSTYLALNELLQLYEDRGEFYNEIRDFSKQIKDKNVLARISIWLKARRNIEIICSIISTNLIRIKDLSEKNNVKIIFQTYPTEDIANKNIKEIAKRYYIPLVDNYSVFEELLKLYKKKDFFVADEHCNPAGYGVITENIYETLIEHKMVDNVTSKL